MNPLDDDDLDRALAQLPQVKPPAFQAHAVRERAQAVLAATGRARTVTPTMRAEPAVLLTLAAVHLCWALVRVYVFR